MQQTFELHCKRPLLTRAEMRGHSKRKQKGRTLKAFFLSARLSGADPARAQESFYSSVNQLLATTEQTP